MLIAGVDEAGRGPLAGPVVAAAVILPDNGQIEGLTDSKKLSPRKRAILEGLIIEKADYALGVASVAEIDKYNILQATMLAMSRAVAALSCMPDHVRVDGNILPSLYHHGGRRGMGRLSGEAVIGGDALHQEISAASILAKEARDRIMCAADRVYPAYGWARNKGYGTAQHRAALHEKGPCLWHRHSFAPVAQRALFQEEDSGVKG